MNWEIVFTASQYARLCAHLLQDRYREQLAFILAGVNQGRGYLRLLGREIIPLPPESFKVQSGAFLQVNDEISQSVLQRCYDEGLSLIEAHSHPFCEDNVAFSGTDTDNEHQKFPYVARKIPNIFHATVVFGQQSVDAHMWDKQTQRVVPINHVRVIATPFQWIVPTSQKQQSRNRIAGFSARRNGLRSPDTGRTARQVMALGREGQQQLEKCTVGIVGLGGTGSAVAQALGYLGVKRLILVDHDRVETSNLNRLIGATPWDARWRLPKVEVARRHLREINPRVKVVSLCKSVTTPKAIQLLKGADILFGCTDNHGSRLVLNQLSVKYLIPYIDIGTGIDTDGNGHIKHAGGQVRIGLPGDFCLECINGIDRVQAAQDLATPWERERQRTQGYISGENVHAPAVIFLNQTLASMAVAQFAGLITGFKAVTRVIFYDLLRDTTLPTGAMGRMDCVCCGEGRLLGLGDLEPFPDFGERDWSRVPNVQSETKDIPEVTPSPEKGGYSDGTADSDEH